MLAGGLALAGAASAHWRPAFAQAVGQVAVRSAEDAFGTGVEGDVIGLYAIDDARGASPLEAGNVRIEGLYAFVDEPTDRLSDASFVAVGMTALDAIHAAPSGVVDFILRGVEESSISVSTTVGDRFSTGVTIDAGWRGDGPLSLNGGIGASTLRRDSFGDDDHELDVAGVAHWEGGPIQASIFGAHVRGRDLEEPILYESPDGAPPPQVPRRRSFHQPFVGNDEGSTLFGVTLSAPVSDRLLFRGGVFLDSFSDDGEMFESFEIDDSSLDGLGRRVVTALAPSRGAILSGELRLERTVSTRTLEGFVFASLRGRRERNRVGGLAEADLDADPVPINFRGAEPRPDFDFEADNRDAADQQLAGVGARLTWNERIEINLGAQHSWYRQHVREEGGGPAVGGSDRRMLGNIGVAFRPAAGLRLYAGYIKGLEELGAAPFTAANANVALAAATATQRDIAVEWTLDDSLTLIVGAFELRRPFADVDDAQEFGVRGEVRNRGIELSGVWRPSDDIHVIVGIVLQEPLLFGEDFDRGTRAPAQSATRVLLEADVAAPLVPGLFFTLSAAHEQGVRTNAENSHTLSPQTTLDLGLRYEFEAGGAPMQLELSIENATDDFFWRADGSDGFTLGEPRTMTLSLTADF